MYPARYQLPDLAAHVVAVLERRRQGYGAWDTQVEAQLLTEAQEALAEAGRQFAEVVDDKGYWQRLEQLLLTAVLPRYFKMAAAEHQLEREKYRIWRGGDFISRAAYSAAGLLVAAIIWRTAIPDWLEPLPLAFFIGGPLIPDLQAWFEKRRYSNSLASLVDDMRDEAAARDLYRPLLEGAPAPVAPISRGDEKQRVNNDKGGIHG